MQYRPGGKGRAQGAVGRKGRGGRRGAPDGQPKGGKHTSGGEGQVEDPHTTTTRPRVCVCVTGIGHINVLGPNPLTLPAVQSEENLAADGIPGRLRLASAMPVCRAAVRRPDAATKVP